MAENGTSQEYWKDVRDCAASAVSDEDWSKDVDLSDRVHEIVDGSQWVIYTWRNLKVLEHTAHFDAYEDHDCGETSLSEILAVAAYYAMLADVHAEIERLEDRVFDFDSSTSTV
jgi:hypothetical protein